MRERFQPSDYRFLAICLALLAGTTWFAVNYFHRAFPEASIDFRVNREEGRAIAERFLAARGYPLAGYRQAARFSYDDDAKTFLEREAGLERANQMMGSRVRVWSWSNRWFRPQQKEEFRADVSPRGEVTGFEHAIPEEQARPSIPVEQARAAAEDFLRTALRRDPAGLEFVEGSSLTRPARTDHVFTWKERDFDFKNSTYRVQVTVLGNEIGGYREFLKVPEQWLRDYERLRSKNQAAQVGDTAAMALLVIGLLASLITAIRRHDVRWRRAATIGLIGGGLFFLSSWNEFPLTEFGYPTTDSYSSFLFRQAINSLLGALASGGLLFALAAAAEPLYRAALPDKVSIGNLFRPASLRTKSFFLGTVLGITLTGVFIAYQIGFYMIAYRFGAWSPADVPYTDLLNTRLPWAYVLFGGFLPAVSEEFLFRMFAIPFLRKLVRSMAVAIVLAGFLWGFGHSGYPQQPFFIRGLEVGMGGVALGLIMLRWGILPALVWHYSVDAMYSALLLMRSDSLYFKVSGAAAAGIMLLPAVIALAAYVRRGGFEPAAGLANGDETPPAAEPSPGAVSETPAGSEVPAAAPAFAWPVWTTRRRITALVIFVCGVASLGIPVERLGRTPPYRLNAADAVAAGNRAVGALGGHPEAFRHVAAPGARWDGEDAVAGKYLLERRDISWVANAFERYRPIQHWSVRYYKPLDKEEFRLALHPGTGRLLGFQHTLAEDAPGADTDAAAIRQTAIDFAAANGFDVRAMDLKETNSEKKKARRDHSLVWEARPGDPRNVDEARFRVHVQIAGDRGVGLRGYWKVPEAYVRERQRQNAISIAITVARIALSSLAIVVGLIVLGQATRRGTVRWGAALRVAMPFTLLAAMSAALTLHLGWRNYDTAMAAETFQMILLTSIVTSVAFLFIMQCALAGFLQATVPESLAALGAAARRYLGIDAVLATLLALGLGALASQLRALLAQHYHQWAQISPGSPQSLGSLSPVISILATAAGAGLTAGAALSLAAFVWHRLASPAAVAAIILLLVVGTVPGGVRTLPEFLLQAAGSLLMIGAAAVFIFGFARGNLLAYALTVWAVSLRDGLTDVLEQPNPTLQLQGYVLVAIVVFSLAWAAWPELRRRREVEVP